MTPFCHSFGPAAEKFLGRRRLNGVFRLRHRSGTFCHPGKRNCGFLPGKQGCCGFPGSGILGLYGPKSGYPAPYPSKVLRARASSVCKILMSKNSEVKILTTKELRPLCLRSEHRCGSSHDRPIEIGGARSDVTRGLWKCSLASLGDPREWAHIEGENELKLTC